MKKDEAKRLVIAEWRSWFHGRIPDNMEPLVFYTYLENEKSHLLNFSTQSDKYQIVAGWINRAKDRMP